MADRNVHLDPEEVDAFADALGGTIDYYRRVIDRLEANISRLGKTWRDDQFQEFTEEVATLKRGLADYIAQSETARRTLGELARSARRYHGIQAPR